MLQHKTPCTQLELSLSRISNNYNYFRSKLNPQTKLLVLEKANSYGHGSVEFSKVVEKLGADYIGVAFPNEGALLRKEGVHIPILVLTMGTDSFQDIIDFNLEPGIPNIETLSRLDCEMKRQHITHYSVHIKLDTGMHRLGFMEDEIDELIDFLCSNPGIEVKSIYSHLVAADDPTQDEMTINQVRLFNKMNSKILRILPYKPMLHILNSAGTERFPQFQYDMVRVGIGMYGLSATNDSHIKPVAFFRCPILQIKDLSKGATVGYGQNGVVDTDHKKIATISAGYADGLNRHLGNGNAYFDVNGHKAYTIGSICMDMCMIDITGIDAEVGDTVTIFGDNPSAKDLADVIDTIPYEIMTSVSQRVKKVLID